MSVVLIALILGLITPPPPSFDQARTWFTLETDDFSVHFSCRGPLTGEAEELAREIGGIAEEVRATVELVTGLAPEDRVQVVVTDFYDYCNGWASPFPSNTIAVIPTPPAGDRTNDDNWLRTLILHEYSHILQMEMARGPALALRRVFGRIILPNALMPAWLTEGYAVFNETRMSEFGRGHSPEFRMYLRTAARGRRLLPIDRCSGYDLQDYPAGNAPYLYGSQFVGRIARDSAGVWDRFNLRHSRSLPFTENLHARATFGSDFPKLWNEWPGETTTAVDSATRLRRITSEGYATGAARWSKDGTELYYLSRDGREQPSVKAVEVESRRTRILHRGSVTGTLGLSPDGARLAFAEYQVQRNGYEFTTLCEQSLATGRCVPIPGTLHGRDPDYAPDTSLLVFVRNHDARNDVVLLDLRHGGTRILAESEERADYHSPRFSPGGRWVAVGVRRPGGWADIELLDRSTGWTVPVTHDRANDLSPSWSPSGRFLYFVSDRTGVFNLYAYSIANQALYRCTEVDAGVFEPAASPDNRLLALTSHTPSGSDIHVMSAGSRRWRVASDFVETLPAVARASSPDSGRLYYYTPFPTVLPRFWLPWVAARPGLELGAFTLGWDVLQMHGYSAAAGYRDASRSPFVRFDYVLSRWRPNLTLSADVDLTSQTVTLGTPLQFISTFSVQQASAGLAASHDSLFKLSFSGDWAYSSARTYRFGAAPSDGRFVILRADSRLRPAFSDRNLTRLVAGWSEYVGAPRATWSLRCRVGAGTSVGDTSADRGFTLSEQPGLLGVRGFSSAGPAGRHIVTASLQFRTPLWWPERGIASLPLFLRNINVAVFCDAGTCVRELTPDALLGAGRAGIGVELRADLKLLHHVPVQIAAGAAIGVLPYPDRQLYFRLDSELLSGLLQGVRPRPRSAPEPDVD